MPASLAAEACSTICGTTTFERSVPPIGRYNPSVIEIDCGAMSNFH
jgi:hypothetical protein